VQSLMISALYPKPGSPWAFGLHQCSRPRVWTAEERGLFKEIGWRLTDALTSLLAHRELKRSEAEYRRIVDTANEGIWVLGPDLVTTFVNARASEILGYSAEELIGRPLVDFMFEEDVPDYMHKIESRRQGASENYERRFRHKDGTVIWTLVAATPIFDDDGSFVGTFGMLTDITHRKLVEQALREREREYRTLVENIPDLIARYNRDLQRIYVNPAWETASGLAANKVIGLSAVDAAKTPNVVISKEHADKIREVFETGTSQEMELAWTNVASQTLSMQYTLVPEHDESGDVTSVLSVGHDITERQQAEDALREAARYSRNLIEAALDPFVTVGPDGKIADVNRAMEQATGKPREKLIGSDFARCFTEPALANTGFRKVLEDGSVRDYPLTLRGTSGSTIDVLYNATTYVDDAGEIQGVFAVARDMTLLEQAETETRNVLLEMVEAISLTIEKRDPYTSGHQKRVAELASAMAEEMGLAPAIVEGVHLGGMIHDIGKIYVPAEILSRPGSLSPSEWQIIQTHPAVGAEIVHGVHAPWPIEEMIHQHHERLDGSGYPRGLKGDQILLESRILAVADIVEAMASHRPYRPALGTERALQEVVNGSGTLFDKRAVDACVSLFTKQGFEFSS